MMAIQLDIGYAFISEDINMKCTVHKIRNEPSITNRQRKLIEDMEVYSKKCELFDKIASLSSIKFAKAIEYSICSMHNPYDHDIEIERMEYVYQMLLKNIPQETILDLVDNLEY